MSALNRILALVALASIAAGARVVAAPSLSIAVAPAELKLVAGDSQVETIVAHGTGPVAVVPDDNQCDKRRLVNVVGGKSEHEGGALITSSTYTLFLQAKREAGECTITFAVDTLGHGRVAQTVHVRVLPAPKVSITISPDKLELNSARPLGRLTVTAHGASMVDRLKNTCGGTGANAIATVISSNTSSSGGPGSHSATETLDVLGKHKGDCAMTFWANDVTATVEIHVH